MDLPIVNQHKPVVPDHLLIPLIIKYNAMGLKAPQMIPYILDQVGPEYGLSYKTILRRIRRERIPTVLSQGHTEDTILNEVRHIRQIFPDMGARTMVSLLRQNYGIFVTEKVVLSLLNRMEPQAVARRKKGKYRRRQFLAASLNENWTLDQHDKARKYGLALHVAVEPWSGLVLWAKAWHTNRNPRVVAGWYLDVVRKLCAIPMFTQSDPGSENFGVANMHTMIRQYLDETLGNTIQHRWMRKHQNIKPEIFWSGFRRYFMLGFEELFMEGGPDGRGWYNDQDPLQVLIYRWIVIPWFQDHLDSYIHLFNHTKRRASKNKLLPQGKAPILIFHHPHQFGGLDFKLPIMPDEPILSVAENLFAPPNDPVFQLVPPEFDVQARQVYRHIRAPDAIDIGNLWNVFRGMTLNFVRMRDDIGRLVPYSYAESDDDVPLLDGYQELFAPGALNLPDGFALYTHTHAGPQGRAELVEAFEGLSSVNETSVLDRGAVKVEVTEDDFSSLLRMSDEELGKLELLEFMADFTDSEDENESSNTTEIKL